MDTELQNLIRQGLQDVLQECELYDNALQSPYGRAKPPCVWDVIKDEYEDNDDSYEYNENLTASVNGFIPTADVDGRLLRRKRHKEICGFPFRFSYGFNPLDHFVRFLDRHNPITITKTEAIRNKDQSRLQLIGKHAIARDDLCATLMKIPDVDRFMGVTAGPFVFLSPSTSIHVPQDSNAAQSQTEDFVQFSIIMFISKPLSASDKATFEVKVVRENKITNSVQFESSQSKAQPIHHSVAKFVASVPKSLIREACQISLRPDDLFLQVTCFVTGIQGQASSKINLSSLNMEMVDVNSLDLTRNDFGTELTSSHSANQAHLLLLRLASPSLSNHRFLKWVMKNYLNKPCESICISSFDVADYNEAIFETFDDIIASEMKKSKKKRPTEKFAEAESGESSTKAAEEASTSQERFLSNHLAQSSYNYTPSVFNETCASYFYSQRLNDNVEIFITDTRKLWMLGQAQAEWLIKSLKHSTALFKIILSSGTSAEKIAERCDRTEKAEPVEVKEEDEGEDKKKKKKRTAMFSASSTETSKSVLDDKSSILYTIDKSAFSKEVKNIILICNDSLNEESFVETRTKADSAFKWALVSVGRSSSSDNTTQTRSNQTQVLGSNRISVPHSSVKFSVTSSFVQVDLSGRSEEISVRIQLVT